MRDPDAKTMLDLAARAAFRATGYVEPNPLVGCVFVRPGSGPAPERVIGIGHHKRFGGPHAEVEALNRCRELGNDPAGATVYVTLEPCNAHGRNPPCVNALIQAKVGRVVCAARDESAGKGGGAEALRAAGIPCEFTGVSQRAIDLSEPWRHRSRTPLPWVIAKWAQTIDGKLATSAGLSKWISNERSRVRVHRLRSMVDAVVIGGRTAKSDDPQLTVRGVPRRRRRRDGGEGAVQPLRVVVTSRGVIPPDGVLARTAATYPTLVIYDSAGENGGVQKAIDGVGYMEEPDTESEGWLRRVLARLRAEHGVHSLLVEGGPFLLGLLLQEQLVNELHVHTGPRLLLDGIMSSSVGCEVGRTSPASIDEVPAWRLVSSRRVGDDVQSVYRV